MRPANEKLILAVCPLANSGPPFLLATRRFKSKHPAWAACWSLLRILTLEQRRIVFVHLDEFDHALNAEVGERQDAVFSDAIDPDDAVLDFHLAGDVPQPVFVFTELLGDAIDGRDVMDLVDLH